MLFQSTFLSLWYWIFAILFWCMICNYTFGVPNELLVRARKGGEDAALFRRYARRNIALFAAGIRRQGAALFALAAFFTAVLATLAVRNGHEAAMGVLVLLGPMFALSAYGGRTIQRLDRLSGEKDAEEAYRRAFERNRAVSAGVAALSMVSALGAATLRHGPGWTEALFRGF